MSMVIPQPLIFILVLLVLLVIAALAGKQRPIVVRVPAKYDSIRILASVLGKVINVSRLGEREAFACRLALDEACVNIIEHAYANHSTGEIEATIHGSPGMCTICLTDFGEPYDPQQVASPQFGEDIEQASPGGLGLYLMRTMMDDVQYVASPNGNSLIMVKRSSFQT